MGAIAKATGAGQGVAELGSGFTNVVAAPISGVGQGLGSLGTGLSSLAKGLGDLIGANKGTTPTAPGVTPGGGYGGGGGGVASYKASPAIMRQDYTVASVPQTYSRAPSTKDIRRSY